MGTCFPSIFPQVSVGLNLKQYWNCNFFLKESPVENNICLTFFGFGGGFCFCLNLNTIFSAIFELYRKESTFIFSLKGVLSLLKILYLCWRQLILYFKFVSGKNLELNKNVALSYKWLMSVTKKCIFSVISVP